MASSPITCPRGTTDKRRTTTTNNSSSHHHDSAPSRPHPLICTGAEPIHPVHGPPKPRAWLRPPETRSFFCHFGGFLIMRLCHWPPWAFTLRCTLFIEFLSSCGLPVSCCLATSIVWSRLGAPPWPFPKIFNQFGLCQVLIFNIYYMCTSRLLLSFFFIGRTSQPSAGNYTPHQVFATRTYVQSVRRKNPFAVEIPSLVLCTARVLSTCN